MLYKQAIISRMFYHVFDVKRNDAESFINGKFTFGHPFDPCDKLNKQWN